MTGNNSCFWRCVFEVRCLALNEYFHVQAVYCVFVCFISIWGSSDFHWFLLISLLRRLFLQCCLRAPQEYHGNLIGNLGNHQNMHRCNVWATLARRRSEQGFLWIEQNRIGWCGIGAFKGFPKSPMLLKFLSRGDRREVVQDSAFSLSRGINSTPG